MWCRYTANEMEPWKKAALFKRGVQTKSTASKGKGIGKERSNRSRSSNSGPTDAGETNLGPTIDENEWKHATENQEVDPPSGPAIKVFSTLLEPLGRNHHISGDSFYTTAALAQYLSDHHSNYTGTVQSSRRGFPIAWKTQKLQHMEAVWHENETMNSLAVTWKDKKAKKACHVVTTHSKVGVVNCTEGRRAVAKQYVNKRL
ncbi:hypothetical protein RRG08_063919 [Elysia crispata]|uniref:PiggyBac transposable element-derived protein domain-containing protein n=1 Tax=Elysia crispata TaxID=231223 RepID=A0AAE1CXE3_9GAST|nr:hypothetical protein RRG08_063919 [Elysia crispata]